MGEKISKTLNFYEIVVEYIWQFLHDIKMTKGSRAARAWGVLKLPFGSQLINFITKIF